MLITQGGGHLLGAGSKLVMLGVGGLVTYLAVAVANDPRPNVMTAPSTPPSGGNYTAASPGAGNISQAYDPGGGRFSGSPPPAPAARPTTVIPESWRHAELIDLTVVPKMRRGSPVAVVGFKLKSRADIALKDFEIRCEFFGESGTKLSEARRTAYRVIAAKKAISIDEINFGFIDGEARRVACEVKSAQTA